MGRDINAELRDIAASKVTALPVMRDYAIIRFNPVTALEDLGLNDDPESMDEAVQLQKSLSPYLVYVLVSSRSFDICTDPSVSQAAQC